MNNVNWKEFQFSEIFTIKGGFYNKKPKIENNGDIPFIGAVDKNNGITEFYTLENVKNTTKDGKDRNAPLSKKMFDGNCICVTNNGSVGYAYYQKTKFTCSHDVNPLYLKNSNLNKYIAKFIITAIEKQRVCFKYSRKWRPKRMIKSKILLPSKNGKPDFEYMEKYMNKEVNKKNIKYKKYIKEALSNMSLIETPTLKDKKWQEFPLIDVFPSIQRGKRLTKADQLDGKTPYVSSSEFNNGVDNYIDNNKKVRIFSDCLSIANSGSVGSSFYHPYRFVASDHVTHLKNNNFNEHIYLFISAITSRLKDKYNFNREINDKRMSKEKILLPIDGKGDPDYQYMEQYMINLKISKLNKYLDYLER